MPQVNVSIDVCSSVYLRNPLDTTLGKKILKHSIILMDEIGFDDFNFKKLATHMGSTEASVYRYFENKYKLLSYLVAWYWDYMHFLILLDIRNIEDPKRKMNIVIDTLVLVKNNTATPDYINIGVLHTIVVENASKVYHNKQVDVLKKEGYYMNLQKLVNTIAENILEINPSFKYPKSIATNVIELSLNNEYYIEHLPGLTDQVEESNLTPREHTIQMIKYFLERLM